MSVYKPNDPLVLSEAFDYLTYDKSVPFEKFQCQDKASLIRHWHDVFQAIISITPKALVFWVMENDAAYFMCLPDAAHLANDHFMGPENEPDWPGWPFEIWETCRITLVRSLTMGATTFEADIGSIASKLLDVSLNCLQVEINKDYLLISVPLQQTDMRTA